MLISPDEVVTGALVNAIAVVGRQISKVASGLRKPDEVLATARWFETFRLTGAPPDLPCLSPASAERLAQVLGGSEIQAALQELLAARLTDAPETDASRARDAVRVALASDDSEAAGFAGALADYYDDQICSLVARLEAEEPPVLVQIRSEAFSSRMISVLHAIERHTAALAAEERRRGRGGLVGGGSAGRLLADVTDPFDLEVHRPVQADDSPPGLPVLTAYVPRAHDQKLMGVVRSAAEEGTSGVAVLVGGSSTGKTRACWETLRLLRERPEEWRLWHPIDPSRPKAALRELPSVGPRTVIWLNEAQSYLDVTAGELGERVAAGLRELLRDPARAPVLVLATLWPQYWNRLALRPPTGQADPHAQARELLAGRDVSVPSAFTRAQLQQLTKAVDPRLAHAAEAAQDGQVVQFLAGAPELLARYRNAPPAEAALMNAAIDGRRLGMATALPLSFLEAAAPGYLTDSEWDGLGENWLEAALAYAAAPCKGTRGVLTRIRFQTHRGAIAPDGPTYQLTDYVDQHGRYTRDRHIPPPDFWAAAVSFANPVDLPALASAGEARGLLLHAARLRKRAVTHGDTMAAAALIRCLHSLWPGDERPAWWVAAHAAPDDPDAVATLLSTLLTRDAHEQAAALLARNPAAHVALNDPAAVAKLLEGLQKVGAHEQVAVLLARKPATQTAVDDLWGTAALLGGLREAGAHEQVTVLADRAATHAVLEDPAAVAKLLWGLQKVGAHEQVAVLLARKPATQATVGDEVDVAWLLNALREAGANEQASVLADRVAAHAIPYDPWHIDVLLDAPREVGAHEQASVLVDRARPIILGRSSGTSALLDELRKANTPEQAPRLVARNPAAYASLCDPMEVGLLLSMLRHMDKPKEVAALLACDPAEHAVFHDQWDSHSHSGTAGLLEALRAEGAHEQVATLVDRLPVGGLFRLFREQVDHRNRYRFGREGDGSPAPAWGWDDLD